MNHFGLDTGYYQFGRSATRILIEMNNENEQVKNVAAVLFNQIINTILSPLRRLSADDQVYAVEGEIYGPDPQNHDRKVVIGHWNLTAEEVVPY